MTGPFPISDNSDPHVALDDLVANFGTFTSYSGVEENEDAAKAIFGYVEKGYLVTSHNMTHWRAVSES